MTSNHLLVERSAFIDAVSVYGKKRAKLGPVLLSFEGGFLMVESGGIAKAMSAEGQWHGRATCAPEILRALAIVPPARDPIPISYADGHLLIGNMTGARLRVPRCLFHFHAPSPRRGCFGADERPSAYPHHDGRGATFRQVVEMCAADPVSAAELRDGECEHLRQERLRGGLKIA